MKSIVHNPAPNIVPGLNLTAERFGAIYTWITSTVADTIATIRGPFQYGLSIPFDGTPALKLIKNGGQLELSQCVGITPAGTIIGLFEGINTPMILELREKELKHQEDYSIIIGANHSELFPFGMDSVDLPFRLEHARIAYSLQIQPFSQTMANQSDAFCIGILKEKSGEWQLQDDYVPPCVQLGAHPILYSWYQAQAKNTGEMLELFQQIICKTDTHQDRAALQLREFALQLGSFMSFHQHRQHHLEKGDTPVGLFEFWIAFARQTSFLLKCYDHNFNTLLITSAQSANGVNFSMKIWEEAIQSLSNFRYDHNDLAKAIKLTSYFMETVQPIFKALIIKRLPNQPPRQEDDW